MCRGKSPFWQFYHKQWFLHKRDFAIYGILPQTRICHKRDVLPPGPVFYLWDQYFPTRTSILPLGPVFPHRDHYSPLGTYCNDTGTTIPTGTYCNDTGTTISPLGPVFPHWDHYFHTRTCISHPGTGFYHKWAVLAEMAVFYHKWAVF